MKLNRKKSISNEDEHTEILISNQHHGLFHTVEQPTFYWEHEILARKGPLADGADYILNEEKTDRLLTVYLNCDPGRENPLFTEDGIRAAILGNLSAIEAGRQPPSTYRVPYQPYKKHPKYTGFLALYVHYLYVLGKIEKRQYPPRMTPQLRKEAVRFERCREQFAFLRENSITTQEDMTTFQTRTENSLSSLMKQRTILNVRKKKHRSLYDALTDVEALAEARRLYDEGLSGMEEEAARYMEASVLLDKCGVPRERLTAEKAEIYRQLAESTVPSVRSGRNWRCAGRYKNVFLK